MKAKKMMTMTVSVENIKWDADDENEISELPTEAVVKISVPDGSTTDDIECAVDEALSNEFGFCNNGYYYTFKRTAA